MSGLAIRIEDVSKHYRLGDVRGPSLGAAMKSFFGNSRDKLPSLPERVASEKDHWALRDVSVDIREGEVMGIFGPNGAGKSTLLKIISRITEPTQGTVKVKGRMASLLEVGTGFHPDLTGRENIFLNGAILGMSKAEIKSKFDEIVSFSGVERFLDTPVKRYSSGMYVRLAFSVAAHIEPDILVLDEVLSVGDFEFQKKCLGKVDQVSKKEGRTVIFVSHNLGAVAELCDRVTLLRGGKVETIGLPGEVIGKYLSRDRSEPTSAVYISEPKNQLKAQLESISVGAGNETGRAEFDLNENIFVEMVFSLREDIKDLQVGLMLLKEGSTVFNSYDSDSFGISPLFKGDKFRYKFHLTPAFLKAGDYSVTVSLGNAEVNFDRVEHAIAFSIQEYSEDSMHRGYARTRAGLVRAQGTWERARIGSHYEAENRAWE